MHTSKVMRVVLDHLLLLLAKSISLYLIPSIFVSLSM